MSSTRKAVALAILVAAVSVTACNGISPNIGIGVFGGSRHSGVGVGVGFPIGGSVPSVPQTPPQVVAYNVGDLVAENDLFYRKFLGMTPQNGYVVQDFYKSAHSAVATQSEQSDEKLTDAYVLRTEADVEGLLYSGAVEGSGGLSQGMLNWLGQLNAAGPYVLWYENGRKALETRYLNGQLHGAWTVWYANGQMQTEGAYDHGQRVGVWRMWNEQGVLLHEERLEATAQ